MEHTLALLRRAHEGDKAARDTLVEENLGLVWSIVRRFTGRGVEAEDLFQIGSIGLLKAIDKFDPGYEVQFSTYAVPMITGEIKRFLRDDGMIKVSRSLKEIAYQVRQAGEAFAMKYNREATIDELSRETKIARDEIVVALEANKDVESIYQPSYQSDDSQVLLVDKLPGEENESDTVINHVMLEELMDTLSGDERELITMRYFHGKTQQEIAKKLSISQVQVSRMEKKILLRMRKQILGHS